MDIPDTNILQGWLKECGKIGTEVSPEICLLMIRFLVYKMEKILIRCE